MIFATVGTHYDGFPRLLRALEALSGDLVVQYGHGAPPANATLAKSFMPFPEMLDHLERADAVVMHAGVGSILLAIRHGHVPVVMPRLRRYREHVDDHQAALAERLASGGRVIVAWEEGDLPAAVSAAPPRAAPTRLPETPLQAAVRRALAGVTPDDAQRRPRARPRRRRSPG